MLQLEVLKNIGIIVGSAFIIIILISTLFYFTGKEKKQKSEKDVDKKKKKTENKATFIDLLILATIIFGIPFGIHLYNIKDESATKKTNPVAVVQPKKEPKVNKEDVWKLTWKRSPNVSITFPYKRPSDSFEIKFLKKDSEVMEFVSMTNGSPNDRVHVVLKTENPKTGRKWKGIYEDKKTGDAGFMGFDEVPDDNGGIMYVGEHSDDKTAKEWIPTVIKLKTK